MSHWLASNERLQNTLKVLSGLKPWVQLGPCPLPLAPCVVLTDSNIYATNLPLHEWILEWNMGTVGNSVLLFNDIFNSCSGEFSSRLSNNDLKSHTKIA